jgi:hypothetical protein
VGVPSFLLWQEGALIYGGASWRAATRADRLDAISGASIVSRSAS